jgi:hypothetical protein
MYLSNVFSKFVNYFTTNFFKSLSNSPSAVNYSKSHSYNSIQNNTYNLTNSTNLVKKLTLTSPVSFSKHISKLESSISTLKPLNPLTKPYSTSYGTLNLHLKTSSTLNGVNDTLTSQEASYIYGTLRNNPTLANNSNKSLRLNLHTLYKLYNNKNYPLFFDFNTEKNLNNAKQQRWLVRNSLLTESIINNSFLITQAKKIIGLGTLGKDFTNKTLWLPTKASNLSSLESSLYLNNLSNSLLSPNKLSSNFLNQNHLSQSNFNNLNFFENSRLWVFKKYFFTNQQAHNLVVDYPTSLDKQTGFAANSQTSYSNLNFTTNMSTNNTTPLTNNNFTPSLSPNSNLTNNLFYGVGTPNTTNSNLNLSNLDIIGGSNTGFLFLLTSNPQDTPNSQNYFSNLKYSTGKSNTPIVNHTNITFTQKN